jgi:DNA-binding CsgD family transcriptional regulator
MMDGFTLFIYMISFALGCMTLGLSIVYHMRSTYAWTKYFIVFHASLLGCMMLLALQVFSRMFLSGLASVIVGYVIRVIFIADVTFLVVFIPYFTTWVIAHPWRNPYKTLFYILAACYLVVGCMDLFGHFRWMNPVMVLLFAFDLFFCIGVIMRNLKSIDNKYVRAMCLSIIVVSFSMLPAMAASLVWPMLKIIIYPIYFLAFSITILIFLYIAFSRMPAPAPAKQELTIDQLAQYHITEREFSVIRLIASGLTNKEIASELGISANTVNNHVANIFTKTQVRSRIDLLNLLKEAW